MNKTQVFLLDDEDGKKGKTFQIQVLWLNNNNNNKNSVVFCCSKICFCLAVKRKTRIGGVNGMGFALYKEIYANERWKTIIIWQSSRHIHPPLAIFPFLLLRDGRKAQLRRVRRCLNFKIQFTRSSDMKSPKKVLASFPSSVWPIGMNSHKTFRKVWFILNFFAQVNVSDPWYIL